MKEKLCVGVVGSGIISEIYLKNMTTRFSKIWVKAVASKHREHAQARAEQFGIGCCSVEELMKDSEIDLIVNLTPVGAHYGIIKAALEAGKHVYTEKTLTDDLTQAAELVELAREKKLYLGSAPDTFLGAGIQTAKSVLDAGTIGKVTGFAVTVNRDWELLMNVFPFLREKGPGMCYDYTVYHLTAMVSLLGPVSTVAAFTTYPEPYKYIMPDSPQYGQELICPNETRVSASLSLRNGVTGTLMMDGDSVMKEQAFLRIYGTKGILEFGDPNTFDAAVRVLTLPGDPRQQAEYSVVEPVNPYHDNCRGIGVADMAQAILTGGRSRVDAELAYHVMEVLRRILESGTSHQYMEVKSGCTIPEPLISEVFP
ncbi:MAG: Gfo/Idh/MocA family oxidoreductase [Roseburia sp.]|nr:Gfo/Idh/MocA family oxidoreductase [Roseburia sp.]MCM1242055.1 Gfo/Idh/MocA family oxidoreductase [Roseburia sp.]